MSDSGDPTFSIFCYLTPFNGMHRIINKQRQIPGHTFWTKYILNQVSVNFWFPLNNFSLRLPIDTKLAVWVVYFKRQLGIATQLSVIKVKLTVTKSRNSVSAQ